MSDFKLAWSLSWGTLRSRPTLTILAIVLLSIAGMLLGSVSGTSFVLKGVQAEFLSGMTVELELADGSDSVRIRTLQKAEAWPDAQSVEFVSAERILRETEIELGENFHESFLTNPFPPIVRIRFSGITIERLDSLTADANSWSDVSQVVYPRQLWEQLNEIKNSIQGKTGLIALGLAFAAIVLLGLCLRAQVRNRSEAWELVAMLGLSEKTLSLSMLLQEAMIGLAGGILAVFWLNGVSLLISWLLLHEVSFPFWFYSCVVLGCAGLAVLAGTLSPRKFSR